MTRSGVVWAGRSLRRTLMYCDLRGQATAFALAWWEGPGVLLGAKSPEGLVARATSFRAPAAVSWVWPGNDVVGWMGRIVW